MIVQDSKPYPRYYPSPLTYWQVYRVTHPTARPEWKAQLEASWQRSGEFISESELVARIARLPADAFDITTALHPRRIIEQQEMLKQLEAGDDVSY